MYEVSDRDRSQLYGFHVAVVLCKAGERGRELGRLRRRPPLPEQTAADVGFDGDEELDWQGEALIFE